MILLIDNYDSFTHNLARYFQLAGRETRVVRNDAIDAVGVRAMRPAAIVISPGPGGPAEAGCSLDVVRTLREAFPILGVCLGHQVLAAAFGAGIVRAGEPMHGRTSIVEHDGAGLFVDLPNPLRVCRYHSLAIDPATLPDDLAVTAWADETPMAISHRRLPLLGVQFHPEAILTEGGERIVRNFLRIVDASGPAR